MGALYNNLVIINGSAATQHCLSAATCRLPLASRCCLLQPPLALSPSSETRTHAKNVKCKRKKKKKFRGICGKNRWVFYARQRGEAGGVVRGRGHALPPTRHCAAYQKQTKLLHFSMLPQLEVSQEKARE